MKGISINKLKSPSFVFLFTRYITYGLQLVNSILLAIVLGPFYLGIWGFITLMIQYFNQFNFGIAHYFNVVASIKKGDKKLIATFLGNSFFYS